MTISIPSRPIRCRGCAATLDSAGPGAGFLAWLGEGVQWESDEPAAVVGWVHGDEFQVRERQASSRYAWRLVGRGRIVPTVAGTDLRITIQPWAPDLLGPQPLSCWVPATVDTSAAPCGCRPQWLWLRCSQPSAGRLVCGASKRLSLRISVSPLRCTSPRYWPRFLTASPSEVRERSMDTQHEDTRRATRRRSSAFVRRAPLAAVRLSPGGD